MLITEQILPNRVACLLQQSMQQLMQLRVSLHGLLNVPNQTILHLSCPPQGSSPALPCPASTAHPQLPVNPPALQLRHHHQLWQLTFRLFMVRTMAASMA